MLVSGALVALAGVALGVVVRQLGLHAVADLDDGEVGRALQHGAGHQIAHAAAELIVDGLTPGLAHERGDDALGVLGGDAAHIGRRHIALLELAVLAGLLIGLAHGHELGKRLLQTLDEIELVDLALVGQRLQCLDQL